MLRWLLRWSLLLAGAMLIQVVALQPTAGLAETDRTTARQTMVALTPIVTDGLESPVFLTHAGDGSERLFVVEQPGRIRVLERGVLLSTPFLDITERVLSGGEQGLLGLAFHPDYRRNGCFFVNYNRKSDGATVLAEYRRGAVPTQASRDERVLMVVPQPYANHNGGMVVFGPDGYLYIGRGDGGSGGDPDNRAQNPHELLGKILRIDVDHGDLYGIPSDNPFAKEGGLPEIFAFGLRNPWRFSFDAKTGELWVADVGQNKWEEIDLVIRGGNYGWRVMEGFHCFDPALFCQTTGLRLPLLEYPHEKGRCSVIGGYVYRGSQLAFIKGDYLYGDFCTGEIFRYRKTGNDSDWRDPQLLLKTNRLISSFGEDESGELYVVDHKGGIYQLTGTVTREDRSVN
ncbi:MAG: PQQ-dependent sugar dehydrogenase [Nitrospirae bacterium]|nr:PQQ-dependent sugar dehydrogenase [Nitrospirota bacterium]